MKINLKNNWKLYAFGALGAVTLGVAVFFGVNTFLAKAYAMDFTINAPIGSDLDIEIELHKDGKYVDTFHLSEGDTHSTMLSEGDYEATLSLPDDYEAENSHFTVNVGNNQHEFVILTK